MGEAPGSLSRLEPHKSISYETDAFYVNPAHFIFYWSESPGGVCAGGGELELGENVLCFEKALFVHHELH